MHITLVISLQYIGSSLKWISQSCFQFDNSNSTAVYFQLLLKYFTGIRIEHHLSESQKVSSKTINE